MNIQIFGTKKSFDTKKAQRFFKERRIPFQYIDLPKKGFSPGEYRSVRQRLSFEQLVNTKCSASSRSAASSSSSSTWLRRA